MDVNWNNAQGKESSSDVKVGSWSKTRWNSEDNLDDNASVKSSWSDISESSCTKKETAIPSDANLEALSALKLSSKKHGSRSASSEKKKTSSKSSSSKKKSTNVDLPELTSGSEGTTTKQSSKKKTISKAPSKAKWVLPESDESTEEEECSTSIPSKVKNIPWIHAVLPRQYWPKTKDRPDPRYGGKWMLFADCQSKKDGLTKLDVLWSKIEVMVENGELCGAHASTAFPSTKPPKEAGHGSGTICCLTRNYGDEEDVKLTAEKISATLGSSYSGRMLYKTNEAKDTGALSLYQYLAGGSFWKRSENDKEWILLS